MELSPEERHRIYEEEKARIEARERIERERQQIPGETTVNMEPNIAGWLCYLGVWVTGIIFFVLEQKNNWIRFHAAQSIVVFGTLAVGGAILGLIPFVGSAFSVIVGIIGFIFWIVLQVKAYSGERFRVPWAADIADRMAGMPPLTSERPIMRERPRRESGEEPRAAASPEQPREEASGTYREPAMSAREIEDRINRRVHEIFHERRAGRITGSAFAIAWSIALLVFFNFYYEYVAYYSATNVNGVLVWTRYPFFTDDISLWLPVLTTTLVVSIVGHAILIAFDRYTLRQLVHLVLGMFGLATVLTLLTVFPFDFSVIPDPTTAAATNVGVRILLIIISVGFAIGILVRGIRLLVNVIRGTAHYE